MKLTPKNVTIATATVEIRMLTLDGKHLTQSIFRQLPRGMAWKEDGTTDAVPWGRVSHCVPGECQGRLLAIGHLHVVWQLGSLLFRSLEEPIYERRPGPPNKGDAFPPHGPTAQWERLCALPQLFIGR